MTIRQILCATDLSDASEPAWQEAQRLGGVCEADILVLHVVAPVVVAAEGYFPAAAYQDLVDATHRDAHARLDRLLGTADPRLKLRSRVEAGAAAQRILEVAREEAADLVVMGTHGRSGLGRLVMGSVADRVVRQATCPVVTVRARPAGAPSRSLARICYATDFSPAARAAWAPARMLAELTGAEVDVLHVTLQPVADRHLTPALVGRMALALEEHGRAEVERFLRTAGLPRERVHVLMGRGVVADQVVHWAGARSADLIVMGTHGWSGLLRWMLGSVAQRVVQTAPCPVLTVGPPGADAERA